jgi:hypothetical protein
LGLIVFAKIYPFKGISKDIWEDREKYYRGSLSREKRLGCRMSDVGCQMRRTEACLAGKGRTEDRRPKKLKAAGLRRFTLILLGYAYHAAGSEQWLSFFCTSYNTSLFCNNE